jgi:CspA family cold shock protein
MKHGTIKFFNISKGFGFIADDEGGDDVFVHISGLSTDSDTSLSEGQKVIFDTETDSKSGKLRAKNVTVQ